MDIGKACQSGRISVKDFHDFSLRPALRSHCLKVGAAYLVSPPVSGVHDADYFLLEEVSALHSPERGDFTTARGTTGPISGNVFIQTEERGSPPFSIIVGDRVSDASDPSGVRVVLERHEKEYFKVAARA